MAKLHSICTCMLLIKLHVPVKQQCRPQLDQSLLILYLSYTPKAVPTVDNNHSGQL